LAQRAHPVPTKHSDPLDKIKTKMKNSTGK
jgi:hypothetical protein